MLSNFFGRYKTTVCPLKKSVHTTSGLAKKNFPPLLPSLYPNSHGKIFMGKAASVVASKKRGEKGGFGSKQSSLQISYFSQIKKIC